MATQITADKVVEHYSTLAEQDLTKNAEHIKQVAESFGYSAEDLAAVPEGANLGVSCGNPLAVAGLKAGETVVDLGCGAGFDVFQAARKVGPTGKSIGIDLSESMLAKANSNAAKANITNTEFILAPITALPVPSSSVDCVISNCVINLLPPKEKPTCFQEVFRVLKPGGRFSVSDILAKKEFGEEMRHDLGLYVGCVSGASLVAEYEGWLREAGFQDILIVDKKSDLNIYKERILDPEDLAAEPKEASCCGVSATKKPSTCCGSSEGVKKDVMKESAERIMGMDLNEWVSSFSIYAVKPME